ncbi:unnamed protein product [Closterium sp. Naga37s-1]|nr:unnamed protein product [Closterium sp. Naga37s-1]
MANDADHADTAASDPDPGPSCSSRPITGMEFLRRVHRSHEHAGDQQDGGGDYWGGDDWYRRDGPDDDEHSDGVEVWVRSPRQEDEDHDGQNEVCDGSHHPSIAEPAETAPTQVVDASVPDSTASQTPKKRPFTQSVLRIGLQPVKPAPTPPPPAKKTTPVVRLTAEEKKEKLYLKAQKSYTSEWLPRFPWLILDKSTDGFPCVRCSVCIEHGKDDARYDRNGKGGRDLQIGSFRWHEESVKHDDAMKKQMGLMKNIEEQKRIDDLAKGDPEGARISRLMRSIVFVCKTDTPIQIEALAVKNAAEAYPDFNIVDDAIRALGSIVGKSTPWYERFKELQQVYHKTNLEHQGLHNVRWLAQGEAVLRMCRVLGAAICVFIEYEHKIASTVQTLKFHFCVYFLADILAELNNLNRFFQRRKVDVTIVAQEVDRTVSYIQHRYIDYETKFGEGLSPQLSPFLERHKDGKRELKVEGVDSNGRAVSQEIVLSEAPIAGHKFGGTMRDCEKMCKAFAKQTVHNLTERMADLRRMGGTRLFKVESWPPNLDTRERRCLMWLRQNSVLFNNCLPGENLEHFVSCACLVLFG